MEKRKASPLLIFISEQSIIISVEPEVGAYFSRFVFRFTKLAYRTLKPIRFGEFYLQVLEGKENYQGFVTRSKQG